MARFLAGILCPDGDIPPLGDAVRGFAAAARRLLALAERFAGARPAPRSRGRDVVRRRRPARLSQPRAVWAIFDAGPVCADYLPGHGQADSLTVEVWCDGACVVGDPGVHEYTGPGARLGPLVARAQHADRRRRRHLRGVRQLPRRRPRTHRRRRPRRTRGHRELEPFGIAAHFTRRVQLAAPPAGGLEIIDSASAPAGCAVRSRLHLHPAIQLVNKPSSDGQSAVVRSAAGLVRITGQHPLRLEPGRASRRYGVVEPTTILVQDLRTSGARENLLGGVFSIEPLGGS